MIDAEQLRTLLHSPVEEPVLVLVSGRVQVVPAATLEEAPNAAGLDAALVHQGG